jgi:glutathione S-transferase
MILLGQYDSPFVRRVAITLHHYELDFEHRPWSVWADADKIATFNPLRRVPSLVLADGSALLETFAIIDYLDELVEPARALLPAAGAVRRAGLRVAALAAGVADKAVLRLYSSLDLMHGSELWVERCSAQILDTLAVLNSERAGQSTTYWLGDLLSHADIALACAYRFTREAHPDLLPPERFPSLTLHADGCEHLPLFQRAYLAITNNLKTTGFSSVASAVCNR